MALTGDDGGSPLAVPWPVAQWASDLARGFGLDASLLAERAALGGLTRNGQVSCGGATRLLATGDGWVALSLARPDDVTLLPALLDIEVPDAGSAGGWAAIATAVTNRSALELEAAAATLGLALGAVGRRSGPFTAAGSARPGARGSAGPVVVDLSALWAGPLCTHLLQRSGARVIKVEDLARPDGARWGSGAFFHLLNGGKQSVAFEFRSPKGRARLAALMEAADVVVTSSRARAFDQLGILPDDVLVSRQDKVWVAVTGYGWESNQVGFGDDTAAAAGLVAWHPDDGRPRFAADAVADPLCGLRAARLTLDCLARGGRWFVDASLAGAVSPHPMTAEPARSAAASDGGWCIDGVAVERPRGRVSGELAPSLGADTEAVVAELLP